MADVGQSHHTCQLPEDPMAHLVQRIAGMLVNQPEHVVINKLDSSEGTVLQLSVDRNDVGRVIGKGGSNVRAIRTILSAAGRKLGRRITLEIVN